jgi:hypothetical protein
VVDQVLSRDRLWEFEARRVSGHVARKCKRCATWAR